MLDLVAEIARADAEALGTLLDAVLDRYALLYPDWEIYALSLCKNADQNEQLDRIIGMLQNMKIPYSRENEAPEERTP